MGKIFVYFIPARLKKLLTLNILKNRTDGMKKPYQ